MVLFISCQREVALITQDPLVPDSTNGELLVRYAEVWNNADSLITTYEYNDEKLVIAENSLSGSGYIHYDRNSRGKIVKIETWLTNADTAFTNVFYANEDSGKINYTLSYATHGGSKILDSSVYIYDNGKVIKILFYSFEADTAFLGSYYTWNYDANGNILQLNSYTRNDDGSYGFNIGYDFEYDDKINPFFSHDDVRMVRSWYISSSPNNLTKQTNHYGEPPSHEDDYIALVYEYDADGKPYASARTGPAIAPAMVQSRYYYK